VIGLLTTYIRKINLNNTAPMVNLWVHLFFVKHDAVSS
jgi:hypothetical protein